MIVDGIIVCVGEEYCELFRSSLPVWWDTLNSLTIVTKGKENVRILNDCIHNEYGPKFKVIETEAFGQYLNKGAALNVAYIRANPSDWILSFDCDIIPPDNWKMIAEKKAVKGKLNGAWRYDFNENRLDEIPFKVKGYFQLWHVSDVHFNKNPVFIEWCEHAGRYDTLFRKQWKHIVDLGFKLIHQGPKTTNWFGPGTTPAQMQQALVDAKKGRMQ